MIELWSKEQIDQQLSYDEAKDLYREINYQASFGNMVEGKLFADGKWELLEYRYIPTESATMVLGLVGKNLVIRVVNDIDRLTKTQVFQRTRMVPVKEFVTAQEM